MAGNKARQSDGVTMEPVATAASSTDHCATEAATATNEPLELQVDVKRLLVEQVCFRSEQCLN